MFAWGLTVLLLSLSVGVTGADDEFNVKLEPGHVKQDYDSMEEVRGHENETETEKPAEDEDLIREAILDVAYYLRRFKFSGYDPRSLPKGQIPEQNLFVAFPSPPLRNIHWEVKKNCEPSFVECVIYLQKQLTHTFLPRVLDSLTVTKQNGWSFITDKDLIKRADEECLQRLERDEGSYEVFSGPEQRFQWLLSASYYMCYYTMKETLYLKTFADECDNFASCIEWDVGFNNKDVRGNNGHPFACAYYSFCPDPCCPLKYVSHWSACAKESPCLRESDKTCFFSRRDNTNFDSIMLNQWNISCNCDFEGTRFESKSGMCVDIDECGEMEAPCDYPSQTCVNVPGSYTCECSPLGYRKNGNFCEMDPYLQEVFYPPHSPPPQQKDSLGMRLSERILRIALNFLYLLTKLFRKVWALLNWNSIEGRRESSEGKTDNGRPDQM